jgi:hypothetical protein
MVYPEDQMDGASRSLVAGGVKAEEQAVKTEGSLLSASGGATDGGVWRFIAGSAGDARSG